MELQALSGQFLFPLFSAKQTIELLLVDTATINQSQSINCFQTNLRWFFWLQLKLMQCHPSENQTMMFVDLIKAFIESNR